MNPVDILPVVLPGAIIQVLLQAYYIKQCWHNPSLTTRQKTRYIITMALFSLPAVAVYLFSTIKKERYELTDLTEVEVDGDIRQGIFVVLVIAFEIFALGIITESVSSGLLALKVGLLAGCFIIMLVYGLFAKKLHKFLYFILPSILIVLALLVEHFDSSAGGILIVLVVLASIINGMAIQHARLYALATYVLYFVVNLAEGIRLHGAWNSDPVFSYTLTNLLVFTLVTIVFYTLNIQLMSNNRLQVALKTLKEQSLQLEEMSAFAERSRITGEIHDTVGHTLTSAVIAIEAGEKYIGNDPSIALEKFLLAKEQVKQGLSNLRSSVKTIKSGGHKPFIPELRLLLDSIQNNTGLAISAITEIRTELVPVQQYVLLRAIKECATNSIKHGSSTEADLLIQEYKDNITLTFTDNGQGAANVVFGFGLTAMVESVQSIGGTLTVDSSEGEGFTINITIPLGTKKEAELL